MCGRYVRISTAATFAQRLGLPTERQPDLFAQYNVAPSQPALAIAEDKHGARHFGMLRWGFVPRWAADAKKPLINARAETAAGKASFAEALRLRRCLVPADGYYEWQQLPGRRKQPFAFRLHEDEPFAFAGLWDVWQGPEGPRASFCILTTEANELTQPVHARMPVIVAQRHYELWLSRQVQEQEALEEILRPYPADAMRCFPVGAWVNDPRNDGPECLLPPA
jgi:putative SOS response-associated peptidase YedK